MSTIEQHTVTSTLSTIPIGRRIAELLQERGDAFSIRAFAERIGMNRETFRTILKGERPITLPELEKVTQGLRITEQRLRQMDTYNKQVELESLLNANERTKEMMLRAQSIANELLKVAQGFTERCVALMQLGQVQTYLQLYDEAHQSWLSAMELAEKINEEFNDSTLLYHLTSFLLISFTTRKEYTSIQKTLDVVEGAFATDPMKMGYTKYARMKWHEHRGNIDEAKRYSYLALDCFKQTDDKAQIGKAMINVGHFEFHTGNYEEAKTILHDAIQVLRSFDYPRLFAVKDYVKSLLKLGDHSQASKWIEDNITKAKEYPDLHGKLQILYSKSVDDPSYAIAVSDDPEVNIKIRYSACKFLMEHYTAKRDSESVMLYYEKGSTLLKGELIDEEGF